MDVCQRIHRTAAWNSGGGDTGQRHLADICLGFGKIFIITQMHSLGLSRRVRWALLNSYVGVVLWVYSNRGWEYSNEIIRIPVIDYVAVLLLAGLIWLGLW